MVPMLSHHKVGDRENRNPSSKHNERIQESSKAVFAMALYSASVLDLATIYCLKQLHDMRLSARKIHIEQFV